jgi:hypothetical protein
MIRAFEVDVDGDLDGDDETAVMCNQCLGQVVFEFGMQPGDREMRVRVVRTVEEAGSEECPSCGEAFF